MCQNWNCWGMEDAIKPNLKAPHQTHSPLFYMSKREVHLFPCGKFLQFHMLPRHVVSFLDGECCQPTWQSWLSQGLEALDSTSKAATTSKWIWMRDEDDSGCKSQMVLWVNMSSELSTWLLYCQTGLVLQSINKEIAMPFQSFYFYVLKIYFKKFMLENTWIILVYFFY